MRRDEAIRRLTVGHAGLAPFGVRELYLFGSVARDEATDTSDVDVLVEFEATPSLFEFVRLRRVLSEILGRRVDLVTRAALKAQLRDRILAEAIRAA